MSSFWEFWVYLPKNSLEFSNAVEYFMKEKEAEGCYDFEWKALMGLI